MVCRPNVLTSNVANSIGPIKGGSAASDNQPWPRPFLYYGCGSSIFGILVLVVLLIFMTGERRQ